jgi:archaellum component FlaC
MAKELVKCKKCGEEKQKETSFTRKGKQVTCDECLEKAKNRRATSNLDRMTTLEKQNEKLQYQLDKTLKDKQHYQDRLEVLSEKYSNLCLKVGELTLHK